MQKNCLIVFIILLDCWYSKNTTCVKWGESFPSFVKPKTGKCQGGIFSPALFSISTDGVLIKLEKSGLCCHIYKECFSSFMYADLLLVSILLPDLQNMINVCNSEF